MDGGLWGTVLGALWAVLEPFWAVLELSWEPLGPPWSNLRPCWRHHGLGNANLWFFYEGLWPPGRNLGGLVSHLGAVLGRWELSWEPIGLSWGRLGAILGI